LLFGPFANVVIQVQLGHTILANVGRESDEVHTIHEFGEPSASLYNVGDPKAGLASRRARFST
jgi:hypothetical protein